MTEDRQNALDQEAIRWLVALRDDEATAIDHEEFERWLDAGPEHQAAWQWACEVWADADKAAPAIRQRLETQQGAVVAFRRRAPQAPTRFRPWMQVAAALCVLAAGAVMALQNPDYFADVRTASGELRSVVLADGSVADMDSGTALSFSVEDGRRVVTLYAGEAHFRVTPDAARAFVVRAGEGSITALGTAFNVKLLPDSVTVAVTEHAIEVATSAGQKQRLSRGQQVSYGARGIGAVSVTDETAVLAWQRRRLVLQDTRLGDVLADIDRHRPGRIVVLDEAVRAIPVTAVLDIADTEAALATIEQTFPVKVRPISRYLTLISTKN